MLVFLDRDAKVSLQEQLYRQIRQKILDGAIKAGAPVPSSRNLAQQLRISRNSVTFAYERLVGEGYLVTRPVVGTFVAETLPENMMLVVPGSGGNPMSRIPAPAEAGTRKPSIPNTSRIPIDFWTQRTDPRAFPLKSWRRLVVHALATAGHNLTEYGDPCGLDSLRAAIAGHVAATRDIQVKPEQVIIVAGAQLGLNLALRILSQGGDDILIENPCSQGAAYLFESLKMKPHPIDVDAQGLDVGRLDGVRARIAYVMPSHQFPMGGMLSSERRLALLDWANRTGAYIIEDDYDSEFHYDGTLLPAMKAISPENTIYLATFSKSLGAGLRIGYAIFPSHLVQAAGAAKALLDNGQAWLEQEALMHFLNSGGFMRHLRRVRLRYRARRDALVTALERYFPDFVIQGAETGTHLACRLPPRLVPASDLQARAHRQRIGVYSVRSGGGHEYGGGSYERNWLLLGYSALLEEQIEMGIARFSAVIKEKE